MVGWWDGSNWNQLEATKDTDWQEQFFDLPASAENLAAFKVRFRSDANKSVEAGDVDNFEVLGVPDSPSSLPSLSLDKSLYLDSDPIVATYGNGPGNTNDRIVVYDVGVTPGLLQTGHLKTKNATNTSGSVTFNAAGNPAYYLDAGDYKAYYLCCGGENEVLAGPAFFTVIDQASAGAASAAWTDAYAPDGVTGSPITVLVKVRDISGKALTVGGDSVTGSVSDSNTHTLSFSDNGDGTYVGQYTPTQTGSDTVTLSINSTALSAGPFTSVVGQGFQLKVMSFNVQRADLYEWYRWRLAETVAVIQEVGADVVGLQESHSDMHVDELADALGFNYVDYDSHIISRYPIVGSPTTNGHGVKILLPTTQTVYVLNTHWGLQPNYNVSYIPYAAATGNFTEQQLIDNARLNWETTTLVTVSADVAEALANSDGVFLVGDFNEPSYLDWTQAAASAGLIPQKVDAPLSNEMYDLGFSDAFRDMRSDEVNDTGHTWTPRTDNVSHDRIDMIYYQGSGINVTSTQLVGENAHKAEYIAYPWPSDHRAVVSTFTISP